MCAPVEIRHDSTIHAWEARKDPALAPPRNVLGPNGLEVTLLHRADFRGEAWILWNCGEVQVPAEVIQLILQDARRREVHSAKAA